MLTTKEQALSLLYEAQANNPGPWVEHSICVAECAQKLAAKCGMDPEKAFVMGLLHDIGRTFGITYFAHVTDGYDYLTGLGFDEQARICLTHSFPTQDIREYIGHFDVSKERRQAFADLLASLSYDDYDRLIQLCDSVAGVEVCDMNRRMDDVAARYGYYPEEKTKQESGTENILRDSRTGKYL